jgi:hypothetical protein
LDDDSIASIGEKLTTWIVGLLNSGEGKLVLQKMTSTLAIYYLLPRVHATTSIRTILLVCAARNPPAPASSELFQTLNVSQLTLGLWFCKNLAEEATYKITGYPSDIVAMTMSRMHINLPDIVALIQHCLTIQGDQDSLDALTRLRSEALSALLTWALFVQKAWPSNDEVLSKLRLLIEPALSLCTTADSADDAMDILSDLLTNFGTFFGKEHLEKISNLLISAWGASQLEGIWQESEMHPFAKLVLAFGEVTVKDLAYHPDSDVSQRVMSKCPVFVLYST